MEIDLLIFHRSSESLNKYIVPPAICTTGDYRRVSRWEHEPVLEALEERMDREPERMHTRKNTVEHPFGTIKAWMGATHFQMRTLELVSTDMSLHVLAYNLKRVLQIIGAVSHSPSFGRSTAWSSGPPRTPLT